jgi:hypothetical protein
VLCLVCVHFKLRHVCDDACGALSAAAASAVAAACALLGVVEALRSAALRTPHTGLVAGLRPPPASAHSAHTAGAGGGPGRPGAWRMGHGACDGQAWRGWGCGGWRTRVVY